MKRQGVRVQIVDKIQEVKLSTNKHLNNWKLLSYNVATWCFQRLFSLDDK